ncbi:histidine triad nucleotide binding protein [Aulographum hederae CBS 113979]|uniref:Histidine triad nucleotide binding protein n=1 Tax=Aulographum hederae CBS 113979 TaxID=1176131 RepID=A0A6G1H9P6_9PEZI|nr:histidine triad nucleotide binding protein [Aulographum hederae CBS 113979]
MAERLTTDEEAMTAEELHQSIPQAQDDLARQRNAFTELMSPKKPKSKPGASKSGRTSSHLRDAVDNTKFRDHRDGLLPYTTEPENFSRNRVLMYDDQWVLIRDLYPKAALHLLLLPRDPNWSGTHPLKALNDPVFLEETRKMVAEVLPLAAAELNRAVGKDSVQEKAREEAMEAVLKAAEEKGVDVDLSTVPAGRDWQSELLVGVHKGPSMNHMHIHIISRDLLSASMKYARHYNTFHTPFLVQLHEFPLAKDDYRWKSGTGLVEGNLVCWRCGKDFKRSFTKLREHLKEEFEEWRRL